MYLMHCLPQQNFPISWLTSYMVYLYSFLQTQFIPNPQPYPIKEVKHKTYRRQNILDPTIESVWIHGGVTKFGSKKEPSSNLDNFNFLNHYQFNGDHCRPNISFLYQNLPQTSSKPFREAPHKETQILFHASPPSPHFTTSPPKLSNSQTLKLSNSQTPEFHLNLTLPPISSPSIALAAVLVWPCVPWSGSALWWPILTPLGPVPLAT